MPLISDAYGLVEKARGRGETAEEEVEEAEVVHADENDNILPPSEDAELGHKARRHRLDSSRLAYDISSHWDALLTNFDPAY
jgi:hypothetical protein